MFDSVRLHQNPLENSIFSINFIWVALCIPAWRNAQKINDFSTKWLFRNNTREK